MVQKQAITKNIRISTKKARLVADKIRGLTVEAAGTQLAFSPQKVAVIMLKTLNNAVACASREYEIEAKNMKILDVRVDQGGCLKRVKSRSRGARDLIRKPYSHFTVVVGDN